VEPTLRPSGRIVAGGSGAAGAVRIHSALRSSLELRPGPETFAVPATPRALSPPPPSGNARVGKACWTRRSSVAWHPGIGVEPQFVEPQASRGIRRDSKRSMSVSSCTNVSSLSESRCSSEPSSKRQAVSSSTAVSASSSVPVPGIPLVASGMILTITTYHLCPTHPLAGLQLASVFVDFIPSITCAVTMPCSPRDTPTVTVHILKSVPSD